jgi:hypothetical protein
MELRLTKLKEKIREISPLKYQMERKDSEFVNSYDLIMRWTQSYDEFDHQHFDYIDKRIDKIKEKLNLLLKV